MQRRGVWRRQSQRPLPTNLLVRVWMAVQAIGKNPFSAPNQPSQANSSLEGTMANTVQVSKYTTSHCRMQVGRGTYIVRMQYIVHSKYSVQSSQITGSRKAPNSTVPFCAFSASLLQKASSMKDSYAFKSPGVAGCTAAMAQLPKSFSYC